MCSKNIRERKNQNSSSKKGEQVNSWRWTRRSFLKNWKRSLLTYLENKSCRKREKFFGFIQVPQRVQRKRCYEKCVGWTLNTVGIYFETIFWLKPLVPGVPNLSSGKHHSGNTKNGVKETLSCFIIIDGRWNPSIHSPFSVFQYYLILSFAIF